MVFGIATALTLAGFLLQYLMPGGRMARAGVRASSAAPGAALGIVGFFALPVVGAVVGFPLGIYLAERIRLDLWYINHWSLRLDLYILLKTCLEVIRNRAY